MSRTTTLRGLLLDSRDGEWGKADPAPGRLKMRVIRGTDFADVRTGDFQDVPVRYLEQRHADRKRLQENDILIETAGGTADQPTGRTVFVSRRVLDALGGNVTCASFARFLRINADIAEPEFVFWLLQYHYAERHLRQFHLQHTGVARFQFTSFADTFRLQLPERKQQHRIASILGAYDDLIDVNRRRIALLEEMARRLFEEWFVRFRFPGHSDMVQTPLGTIPKSWELVRLSDVLVTLEAGSRPKGGIKEGAGEIPSIGAENINGLANYDFKKEKLIPRAFFAAMRRGVVRSGDVLLYKDGAHIGRTAMFRDGYPYVECAVNEHVFILRPAPPITPQYLYFWLHQPEMTSKIKALNSNAAQPGLNQPGIHSLPIVRPSPMILARFAELTEPMLALLFSAAKANGRLASSRDLLLAPLLSGELSVSAAESELEAVA